MMLGARTACWEKSGAPLPYDAEVEYIESTGSQYINTGFVPNDICGIRVKASALKIQDTVVVGCRRALDERWWVNFGGNTFNASWGHYAYTTLYYSSITPYVIENNFKNSRSFVVDGVVYNESLYAYTMPQSDREAYIFGANDRGKFALTQKFRVYQVEFSRGIIIEMNLIPVRFINSLGVSEGAMYDMRGVGGKNRDGTPRNDGMYLNQGTGAFIIGPDKV